MTDLPDAIEARLKILPSGLRDHIERSRVVSQELAIRHNVDARLADMGMAAHDLAILEYLDRTIEYFLGNGNLVHTASIELRNELLIRTSE